MPSHIYNLLSQEAKDALQKYNVEAIQKFKASRNLNETQFIHTMSEHTQDELPLINDEEQFQECQEFNTDHDLEPPEDDILEFITIPGLDLVQCAAFVETNHGMVNLIMNEYAYYGKGHSIHSSGQIEWYTNTVDDKSVQVGGQQRIVTIDGYSMPLVCKGGLMYLQLQGIPTDQDLQNYPSVHLTSPHEWDPSVLDYEHPENNGEPDWAIDPNEFNLTLILMNLVIMSIDHCLFLTY